MRTLTILLFLYSTVASADDWVCTQAAGLSYGNTYLSCGVASDPDLGTARLNSFKQAKDEFNEFCSSSFQCKGHAVDIEVKRTDCKFDGSSYRCFRAISFHIGSRKIEPIGENEYQEKIKETEQELSKLYSMLDQVQELKKKENEAEKLKELLDQYDDNKENEILVQAEQLRAGYDSKKQAHLDWVLKAAWSYSSSINNDQNSELWSLQLELEKNVSSWLAVAIATEQLGSSHNDDNLPVSDYREVTSSTYSISVPISFTSGLNSKTYILPEYGYRSSSIEGGNDYNQKFYGASLGMDGWANQTSVIWGFYGRIGARKYTDVDQVKGKTAVQISLGFMFGF